MMSRQLFNHRGQMTVEMILILTILVGLTTFVSTQMRDNELLAEVVSKPWQVLAGMIQNGVWQPIDRSNAAHPNHAGRHATLKCEEL